MSRRKELSNAQFEEVVEWISKYKTLRSNQRGGIIKTELAKCLGVTKSAINEFENKGVPVGTLVRFAKQYDASLDQLFFKREPAEWGEKLVVAQDALGQNQNLIALKLMLARSWVQENLRSEELRVWIMDSTAMEPEIKKGEVLIIDPSQSAITVSGYYATKFNEIDLVVRRFLVHADGTIEEFSVNPQRSIIIPPETLQKLNVFGRVIKIIKDV